MFQLNKSGYITTNRPPGRYPTRQSIGETGTPEAPHCQCVSCRVVTMNLSRWELFHANNETPVNPKWLWLLKDLSSQNWPYQLFKIAKKQHFSKFILYHKSHPRPHPRIVAVFVSLKEPPSSATNMHTRLVTSQVPQFSYGSLMHPHPSPTSPKRWVSRPNPKKGILKSIVYPLLQLNHLLDTCFGGSIKLKTSVGDIALSGIQIYDLYTKLK